LSADDQFANKADLTQFLKAQRTDISSATSFGLISVDGGTNSQTRSQAGVEANLDIQYTGLSRNQHLVPCLTLFLLVGLATGVPVSFVSVGETTKDGADEGFLDIITALIAETAPPQVLTTSYGFNTEADLSKTLTLYVCTFFLTMDRVLISYLSF
jgi:tripeptidyl-peptidase-1